MEFSVLIIILSLYVNGDCSDFYGFNLGHTDRLINDLDRDCLYYNAHDKEDPVFQIIEYCIRFELNESVVDNEIHPRFSFEDLQQANITSDQLYTWSAPVDLIEHYQSYLENKNSSSSKFWFYNCTYPWFGTRCEYSFDKSESSFFQQVETSFLTKRAVFAPEYQKISCYIHLQCDRAGGRGLIPDACLDWREICDGKVDCIDGGHDEEHCWLLEFNECDNETEYRCHIGLCIPLAFLNDHDDNDEIRITDCLDQSDADSAIISQMSVTALAKNKDIVKPVFQYEEHMCHSTERDELSLECGYLICGNYNGAGCPNLKSIALRKAFYIGANISNECYEPLSCLLEMIYLNTDNITWCDNSLVSTYPERVKKH